MRRFLTRRLLIIYAGLIFGVLAALMVNWGNPANMGVCVACFIRDISGALGLHRAGVVQYIRPEIIGFILGAFITAFAFREWRSSGGSSPLVRFFLGAFVMIGALVFLGCPTRMIIRIAGGDLNGILDLITMNSDKLCAMGEIGMDHHFVKKKELYPLQEKIFKQMLELAQKFNLPVILHTKGAEKEVFDILPSYKIPNIDIHWYSGPENLIKVGLDRGYFFSITPAIQYSPPLKKTVELCEPSNLLLESDGPVEYQNQVGAPSMVPSVLKRVSKIKNIPEVDLQRQILKNTKKAFPKIF